MGHTADDEIGPEIQMGIVGKSPTSLPFHPDSSQWRTGVESVFITLLGAYTVLSLPRRRFPMTLVDQLPLGSPN